jgi:hypothetical protein
MHAYSVHATTTLCCSANPGAQPHSHPAVHTAFSSGIVELTHGLLQSLSAYAVHGVNMLPAGHASAVHRTHAPSRS